MPVQLSDNKISFSSPPTGSIPTEQTPGDPAAKAIKLNIEKIADAAAGIQTLTNISEKAAEHAEMFQTPEPVPQQQSTEETTKSRTDRASLSQESQLSLLTPEQLAKMIKAWTLEMEAKIWQDFLNWMPPCSLPLADGLKQLEQLYQALQDAVLNHTTGPNQVVQLARLDQALSDALNRIWVSHVDSLVSFLDQFGTSENLTTLRSSLYQSITGRSLPSKEMEQFWKAGASSSRSSSSDVSLSPASVPGRTTASSSFSPSFSPSLSSSEAAAQLKTGTGPLPHQGMIYRPGARGEVTANPQFQTQLQKNQGKLERISSGSFSAGGDVRLSSAVLKKSTDLAFQSSAKGLYTIADVEKASDFARYIKNEGNLFTNSQLSGKNEEALGVIASVMSIKSQVFTDYSGITSPMKVTVRSTMDKLIDFYLHRADYGMKSETGSRQAEGKGNFPLNHKAVFKVYYHIMGSFQKTGKPSQAITDGIQFALDLFIQKKSDPNFQKLFRYEENAGFFHEQITDLKHGSKEGKRKEWIAGKKLLEQDWKDFVKSLGKESDRSLPSQISDLSPWGMLMEPDSMMAPKRYKSYLIMLVSILSLAVVGVLFLRFL